MCECVMLLYVKSMAACFCALPWLHGCCVNSERLIIIWLLIFTVIILIIKHLIDFCHNRCQKFTFSAWPNLKKMTVETAKQINVFSWCFFLTNTVIYLCTHSICSCSCSCNISK